MIFGMSAASAGMSGAKASCPGYAARRAGFPKPTGNGRLPRCAALRVLAPEMFAAEQLSVSEFQIGGEVVDPKQL